MAVAVQQPQARQEKDPLDVIAKGLGIAASIYGIKEASERSDELKRQRAMREEQFAAQKQQVADKKAGIITPAEYAEYRRQGFEEAAPGTPGSINFKDQSGNTITFRTPTPKAEMLTPYQREQIRLEEMKLAQSERLKNKEMSAKAAVEKESKPTQFQAATFGRRLEAAESVFQNLQAEGYDRTSKMQGVASYLPGSLKPGQLKQQEQAERNFVNALLRRESGSAIGESEFASAEQQYFPRAGDTPEVLAQKAQNRQIALQGLREEAGKAWDQVGQVALQPPKRKTGQGDKPFFVDGSGTATAAPSQPTKEDNAAVQWAKKNPKDPRAAEILRINGVK